MTGHVMEFPETFEEFAKAYSIVDRKEVYTNGVKLIPVFRVKQWLENTALRQKMVDRNALLALADRMDRDGKMQRERQKAGEHWFIDGLDVREYARRIREALGVES